MSPLSGWDRNRARKKGQLVGEVRRPAPKTEIVRCHLCPASSRQLVGQGPRWLDRHNARKHPQEAMF